MRILLDDGPGLSQATVLQADATSQECQIERGHVGCAMAAAHPYERTVGIACPISLSPRSEEPSGCGLSPS